MTRVVLKILDESDRADHGRPALFLNEALAVSAIRHPNIANVTDIGELPDGRRYVMTESLEGESLGQRLRRVQSVPVADALDFAGQAANALAAAHEEGIVHGALTPDNLFLVPDLSVARGERVKVLDFGAGRLRGVGTGQVGDAAPADSSLYLAPEQCAGAAAPAIDQRTDIYALGALLYHMLCGSPPFPAGVACLERPPRRPRSLDAEIPAQVETAILRALAADPAERFASMGELCAALRTTRPSGVGRRRGRARLRGVTLAVAVTVAAMFWSGRTPRSTSLRPLGLALRSVLSRTGTPATVRNRLPHPPVRRPTIVALPDPSEHATAGKSRPDRRVAVAANRFSPDQEEIGRRR
jgi:serine/threonine protein kinase